MLIKGNKETLDVLASKVKSRAGALKWLRLGEVSTERLSESELLLVCKWLKAPVYTNEVAWLKKTREVLANEKKYPGISIADEIWS